MPQPSVRVLCRRHHYNIPPSSSDQLHCMQSVSMKRKFDICIWEYKTRYVHGRSALTRLNMNNFAANVCGESCGISITTLAWAATKKWKPDPLHFRKASQNDLQGKLASFEAILSFASESHMPERWKPLCKTLFIECNHQEKTPSVASACADCPGFLVPGIAKFLQHKGAHAETRTPYQLDLGCDAQQLGSLCCAGSMGRPMPPKHEPCWSLTAREQIENKRTAMPTQNKRMRANQPQTKSQRSETSYFSDPILHCKIGSEKLAKN